MDFIAAVRRQYDDKYEEWTLTNDIAAVASLPDEDTIFVTDIDSLFATLDERHGTTETGLGYTKKMHNAVNVYAIPYYSGNDLTELERHLNVSGQVQLGRHFPTSPQLRNSDIIVNSENVARLDPKKAKAKRKSVETRAAKKPISATALRIFGNEMLSAIGHSLSMYHFQTSFGNTPFIKLLPVFLRVVSVFNALYGDNAHRELVSFQSLRSEWLERPEVNAKAFGTSVFGTWMANEVKEEAVETRKTEWTVPNVADGLEPLKKAN